MRKRVVSILLAVVMSTMLFTGCSTPTEAPTSSAKEETKAAEDTKSSSSGLSAATVLDVNQLPVTGIGSDRYQRQGGRGLYGWLHCQKHNESLYGGSVGRCGGRRGGHGIHCNHTGTNDCGLS